VEYRADAQIFAAAAEIMKEADKARSDYSD
jgi:hypothetical protein